MHYNTHTERNLSSARCLSHNVPLGYDADVVLFIFNDYGFLAVDLPLVLFQARDCMCL